jgi:hypothetical protein
VRPFVLVAIALCACNPDYKLDRTNSRIVVSPGLADFGGVAVGGEATSVLTLTSVAGGDVSVVSADLADALEGTFTVGALTDVPEGGSTTLEIVYTPVAPGWHYTRLSITTSEETDNVHEVDLRGRAGDAGLAVVPARLDFGLVAAGETATEGLTVENTGEIPVTLSSGEAELAVFAVSTQLPVTIEAGDTATLDVVFSPTDGAEVVAALALGTDEGVSATATMLGNACTLGDPARYDVDADGFSACAADCDDGDAGAHPGALETCDGTDEDCDGVTDEGTGCYDDDGDGATEDAGDCNDGDAAVSPAQAEDYTNGIDDDCDGAVDDGTADADHDGYAVEAGDCDAADATVFPDAPELADGLDNDCDGVTDEGTTAYDDDRDGFTEAAGDCDDGDLSVNPGVGETANWTDDDCDGAVDEGTTYGDDDADGFTETGGDCDDADADVNPGAEEVSGNRTDDDCDGVTR